MHIMDELQMYLEEGEEQLELLRDRVKMAKDDHEMFLRKLEELER